LVTAVGQGDSGIRGVGIESAISRGLGLERVTDLGGYIAELLLGNFDSDDVMPFASNPPFQGTRFAITMSSTHFSGKRDFIIP